MEEHNTGSASIGEHVPRLACIGYQQSPILRHVDC